MVRPPFHCPQKTPGKGEGKKILWVEKMNRGAAKMEFPQRKPNRLKDFDYSQNGAYFITICVKDKKKLLGGIAAGQDTIELSEYGLAVEQAIQGIAQHYSNAAVEKYIIMPNHIHLIIMLREADVRTMTAPTISRIIKHMKEFVTKKTGRSFWQKTFHDHIIRNEREYQEIWEYIHTNPMKWKEDCFFIP